MYCTTIGFYLYILKPWKKQLLFSNFMAESTNTAVNTYLLSLGGKESMMGTPTVCVNWILKYMTKLENSQEV